MKPGYQQGNEHVWWWKVAKHLDETQLALVNAIARNADDPTLLHAFEDTVRQAQAILLEIFHVKGLLQAAPNVPQQPPGGSQWPPQFQQQQQFPQAPQHPQQAAPFPQPPPSFPQQAAQVPSPPSFPQQGSQMPSPPSWIPDFSQLSSIPPPPYEPPQEAPAAAAPPETAIADDPQPEAPLIVPESPQPVGAETEADHPVS